VDKSVLQQRTGQGHETICRPDKSSDFVLIGLLQSVQEWQCNYGLRVVRLWHKRTRVDVPPVYGSLEVLGTIRWRHDRTGR
jgi:hypothetical protein